jgi:GTP-binding protein EngB required for normal cell division
LPIIFTKADKLGKEAVKKSVGSIKKEYAGILGGIAAVLYQLRRERDRQRGDTQLHRRNFELN